MNGTDAGSQFTVQTGSTYGFPGPHRQLVYANEIIVERYAHDAVLIFNVVGFGERESAGVIRVPLSTLDAFLKGDV